MVEHSEHLDDARAELEHAGTFARAPLPRSTFDKALLRLLELEARDGRDGMRDGRRAAMIRALEGRATWGQVRQWRRGVARAPQWARRLVAEKLAARRARDLEAENAVA